MSVESRSSGRRHWPQSVSKSWTSYHSTRLSSASGRRGLTSRVFESRERAGEDPFTETPTPSPPPFPTPVSDRDSGYRVVRDPRPDASAGDLLGCGETWPNLRSKTTTLTSVRSRGNLSQNGGTSSRNLNREGSKLYDGSTERGRPTCHLPVPTRPPSDVPDRGQRGDLLIPLPSWT